MGGGELVPNSLQSQANGGGGGGSGGGDHNSSDLDGEGSGNNVKPKIKINSTNSAAAAAVDNDDDDESDECEESRSSIFSFFDTSRNKKKNNRDVNQSSSFFTNSEKNNKIEVNNNDSSSMSDILGGSDIAKLLLEEHMKAEEQLKQMEADRMASELLARRWEREGDTSQEHDVVVNNDQNVDEDSINSVSEHGVISPSPRKGESLLITQSSDQSNEKEENDQQIQQPLHNPVSSSLGGVLKGYDEYGKEIMENKDYDSATLVLSDDLTQDKAYRETVELGEIIIDYVWENERLNKLVSVMAVRASGGSRDNDGCWGKETNEKRSCFESPRQSLADSFAANGGPVGEVFHKDASKQGSSSVDKQRAKVQDGTILEVNLSEESSSQSLLQNSLSFPQKYVDEDGVEWKWLSPWQVDNSDSFGIDRLSALGKCVVDVSTGNAPAWLYADDWPCQDDTGEEKGYYAESRGSIWTKVRCRRWVRPRERAVKKSEALAAATTATSERESIVDNSKAFIVGNEAAGVRCKVCGMVLPMDTDEIEVHLEQGCGGKEVHGSAVYDEDEPIRSTPSFGGNVFQRIGLLVSRSSVKERKVKNESTLTSVPVADDVNSTNKFHSNQDNMESGKTIIEFDSSQGFTSSRFSFLSSRSLSFASRERSITAAENQPSRKSHVKDGGESKLIQSERKGFADTQVKPGSECNTMDIAAVLLAEHVKAEKLLEQMAADRSLIPP